MSHIGRVQNGVVVFEHPGDLPEGAVVKVEMINEQPEEPSRGLLGMLDFIGDAGIGDLSTNLDHYLYGHPKVDDVD